MRHSAAHPPQGPKPPPGSPPGPYDPPGPNPPAPPTTPRRLEGDSRLKLENSCMYPGMKSFHPLERCIHGQNGTPVRAIISHR